MDATFLQLKQHQAYAEDMLSSSQFIGVDPGRHARYHYGALAVSSDVLEPGSPQLTEGRCSSYGHPVSSARVDADVRLLSGSKRTCEGFYALQDEAEFDDTSMVHGRGVHMLCNSSSAKSLGIKRVCSLASSDGIDCQLSQQQQCSVMIPVPGPKFTSQPTAGDVCVHSETAQAAAAAAAAAPAKHHSTVGSSSSSREHGSPAASTTAYQEAASHAVSVAAGLAPIKTQVCPKGPRLRLGGRLLPPDEAQRHLQAVAASAAAVSAGRSLPFAHSPAVTCPGRTSPDGPHISSTSLSSGYCMPLAGVAAQASAGVCAQPLKYATAQAGFPRAPASTLAVPTTDTLPDNFIPTPEGATNWLSLASACDEDAAGVTSRVCSSPSACNSYTGLLMAADAGPIKTEHMLAPPARRASAVARLHDAAAAADMPCPPQISAFAASSSQAWPVPTQQPAEWAPLPPAASMPSACSAMTATAGTSRPVVIPQQPCSWSTSPGWLGNSGSSSSGSGRLAATLAMQASAPAQLTGMFPLITSATDTNPQTHLTAAQQNLTCMPLQQQYMAGGAIISSSRTSSVDGMKTAMWKPAFAPAALLVDDVCTAATTSSLQHASADTPAKPMSAMVPPTASAQQHDPALPKSRWSDGRKKRPGRQASAKWHKQAVQPQPQHTQRSLVLEDGPQQVVMTREDLIAVIQDNMAASWASGYMMASAFSVSPHDVCEQQPERPPLIKPVATLKPFNMPATALVVSDPLLPEDGGGAVPCVAAAAAAAAVCCSSTKVQSTPGHGVDDILPSLQDLLTECCDDVMMTALHSTHQVSPRPALRAALV